MVNAFSPQEVASLIEVIFWNKESDWINLA
jgi:hypothetical protein